MTFWRPARPAAGGDALFFSAGDRTRALVVRRTARARRMRLVVDPRTGEVRLTLPPRAALGPALAWAQGQRDWIEGALAGLPDPMPLVAGGSVPFEGEPLRIEWRPGAPRTIHWDRECGALVFGGPQEMLAQRVLRWLRREALVRLEAETRALASRADVTVGRVAVGDARARWGSCTESGDIRYSWRLVLAPVRVREAIVAHEVAHRLHMHHGPDFHAAVATLLGRDPAVDHAWLRAHGAALYWLGRES